MTKNLCKGCLRAEGEVKRRPNLKPWELVQPTMVTPRDEHGAAGVGGAIWTSVEPPGVPLPGYRLDVAHRRVSVPARGPGHLRVTLQEYAGVESLKGGFRPVQPADPNCFGWGNATEVTALAVKPASHCIRPFEGVSDPLLQAE